LDRFFCAIHPEVLLRLSGVGTRTIRRRIRAEDSHTSVPDVELKTAASAERRDLTVGERFNYVIGKSK
jgi:hypothetical protein